MENPSESPQSPLAEAHRCNRALLRSEDYLAILLGCLVLAVALLGTWLNPHSEYAQQLAQISTLEDQVAAQQDPRGEMSPADTKQRQELEKKLEAQRKTLFTNPLKSGLGKLGEWQDNPLAAFQVKGKPQWLGIAGVFLASLVLFGVGAWLRGNAVIPFALAFVVLFLLAVLAYVLAGQHVIKYYNLEYALWAILLGMVISNTIGTPAWLTPALNTELYIKTGLVLLGAEILLSRLLVLGLPGIFVSWVTTPIVLITTFVFGQYVLRIPSKSLNMVISADMSVCGVSAAIATAAACKAKKEELSLAIGISLVFTVIMMVVMPPIIRLLGMNDVLAGAWLGGTIDSTGAVAAAGGMIGETALEVATTVKMIQNILIGVVAFGVAVYWVTVVEKNPQGPKPSLNEIWRRFPKFVLGFVGASAVFSFLYTRGIAGQALTEAAISGTSEILRGWFFCLAFVSIGLESDFRKLRQYLVGGKALILYVCGQTLNLVLTLFMAWLMFEVIFPQAAATLQK